jgi:hypothetical protein
VPACTARAGTLGNRYNEVRAIDAPSAVAVRAGRDRRRGGRPRPADPDVRGQAVPCDRPLASESQQTFVKRVVGLPGDVLRIVDGYVIRDGKREADAFITACGGAAECTFSHSIRVPQRYIIGVAFFTYWPPDRIGVL